jgi:hypothetical protein
VPLGFTDCGVAERTRHGASPDARPLLIAPASSGLNTAAQTAWWIAPVGGMSGRPYAAKVDATR